MKSISDLRKFVTTKQGERNQIQANIKETEQRKQQLEKELKAHEEAREIIRQTGLKTQETLAFHISDITTLALQAVFEDPYTLDVEFVQRRNKTECDLLFSRNDQQVDPMDASGGGAVDVASFALRVASWAMERPRSRAVIILDEPMRFLSQDLQQKASEMLKQLSDKLGLQFIIVTHEQEIANEADRIFHVTNKKGVSYVETS